jgi:hypothetical protein
MHSLIYSSIFILLLITLWKCTSDQRVDSRAVKEEIENRKLKKISEAEILVKVLELGNMVSAQAQQTLGKNLQEAIQQGGVQHAISFCNVNAMPIVDSLSKIHDASIRRVSFKTRNPVDQPDEIERALLEAYEFQWKDSIPLNANVQKIDDERYLFTKPIFVDNALCLVCHGKPENGLLLETDEFIKKEYPDDQATGYEIGDLRGMWSIILPKKLIVQSM